MRVWELYWSAFTRWRRRTDALASQQASRDAALVARIAYSGVAAAAAAVAAVAVVRAAHVREVFRSITRVRADPES